MKKTLIVLCAAIALVGCSQNRGGVGDSKNRDTGYRSSRDTTPTTSRNMNRDETVLSPSSDIISTNTNSAVATPAPTDPAGVGTTPKN